MQVPVVSLPDLDRFALVIVDVQRGFDDAGYWGPRNKAIVTGEPDLLVTKHVNSAFHGQPDLDAWLRARQLDGFVLSGITTNHCCETTARVGGNLGHQVLFALDATHTFDRRAPDGSVVTADELARVTASNLNGEFATVVGTAQLLGPAG